MITNLVVLPEPYQSIADLIVVLWIILIKILREIMFRSILVLIFIAGFSFNLHASGLDGYTFHNENGNVSLYYKVSEHAIRFKVKNNRNRTVHVTVSDVSSPWTDNKIRTRDVKITYVGAGKMESETYHQTDNYSTMTGNWSFSEWSWRE